jgi:hypothetical protein
MSEDRKWYHVSLRFLGDGVPVDEIESQLGFEASSFGRKGNHLRGDPAYAKYHTNVWVSKYVADSDVLFEAQISLILDRLEPRVDALKKILSLPNVEGELFLGFSSANGQGGAVFSPELLRRVANCGLSLSLDLYPPGSDE